jgi:hypothetical protein
MKVTRLCTMFKVCQEMGRGFLEPVYQEYVEPGLAPGG